uniref:FXYD domain-containing ion transport regulator n=1 Tax=Monopterus albus TaxID=43700 RepID=A0A3Q3J376_MONAL
MSTSFMGVLCEFVDYETLRVGGLIFAGVIVVLSILLLVGNKFKNCGKPKVRELWTNSFNKI